MVLDYVPFDTLHLNSIFKKLGYNYEKIFNFIDYRFCTYIFTKGKNKGLMCCRKTKSPILDNCCKQHLKFNNNPINNLQIIKNNNYIKKEIIYYCGKDSTRKGKCKRRVKNKGDSCNYHCNYNIKKESAVNFKKNNILKLNPLLKFKKCVKMIILIKSLYTTRKIKKQNTFISDDEINILRDINCNYIMRYLGYSTFKEGTMNRYKDNRINLVINNCNQFIENKSKISGGGAIDLLIKIFNYNFKDSINFLNTIYYNKKNILFSSFPCSNKNKLKINDERNKKYKPIPVYNLNNIENVKKYLIIKRKIKKDIIDRLILEKKLYSDEYSNCIFVDENKSYAYIRGTGTIKYILTNGKPNFLKYNFGGNKDVYLFESVIDALSFNCLYSKDGIYIITNGNTLIDKIDELHEIKNCNNIYCCFDNDEKGKEFDKIVIKKIKNKNIIIFKSRNKDFNEDLIQQ